MNDLKQNKRHQKNTHSRYNKERWASRKNRSGSPFIMQKKDSSSDVSDANQSKREIRKQKRQIEAENEKKLRNQKIRSASLDKQIVKSGVINRKNDVATSKEKLKQVKKDLKDQKKELRIQKKNLKKANQNAKKARKKNNGIPSSIFISFFVMFGAFLLATVLWLIRTWPRLKMEELVYEATAPLAGTGSNMIAGFIKQAVVPAGIVLLVVIVLIVILTKSGKKARRIGKTILSVVSVICIGLAGTLFYNHLDLGTYIANQSSSSDFIKDHYKDPAKTNMQFPQKKRNLIYIYLESMEMTYADKGNGGGFDFNCIPELTKLSEDNINFSNDPHKLNGAYSLPNTTWTMGGMFGATSGLPLQISIERNNMDTQTSFFPGITTLGDILKKQGYQQTFECGSDATFGGRKLYFQTHGNYAIHDINYYKEQGILPEDYYVWWGYEDEKLISYAKDDLTRMGNSGQPFNYTMLTADTHFEDGYVCDLCRNDFPGNQYANVMACSSRQISQLVSWIQQQPWYANTTIVLSGDHPTMDTDFTSNIPDGYQRRVYTAYINPDPSVVNNGSKTYRTFSTLDNFPTTLAALGVKIDGNRLGLGTNLFSGQKTLSEEYGIEDESSELYKKSDFMTKIADIKGGYGNLEGRRQAWINPSVWIDSYDADKHKAVLGIDNVTPSQGDPEYLTVRVTQKDGTVKQVRSDMDQNAVFHATIDTSGVDLSNLNVSIDAYMKGGKKTKPVKETMVNYTGNFFLIGGQSGNFDQYLKGLKYLDSNRYSILLSTQGNAMAGITEEERKDLVKLGLSARMLNDQNSCRFAVIDADGITYQDGKGYIRDSGDLSDGSPYAISSAGINTEANSSIQIGDDYTEYSPMTDGFNIVIWDKQNKNGFAMNFNTSVLQPSFDFNATYNPEKNTVHIEASNMQNNPGSVRELTVYFYNKKKITDRIESGLYSSDNKEWTTDITVPENIKTKDMFYTVILRTNWNQFYRVGTQYKVKEVKASPSPSAKTKTKKN